MKSYSHVINIPTVHPFDREEFRWTTFIGEVIAPIMRERTCLYWFTYYTAFARFRIYAEESDHRDILSSLEPLMARFGLSFRLDKDGKNEEWDYTMEKDIGGARFLGNERSDVSPTERALAVLRMLHAGCQLFIHTLVRDGDYWREEKNDDQGNNPFGSSSRSYIHLLHNLAQSDIEVYNFIQGQSIGTMSEYYFSHALAEQRIKPVYVVKNRIKV